MITAGFNTKTGVVLKALGAIGLGVAILYLNMRNIDPFAVIVKVIAALVLVSGCSSLVYALVKNQASQKNIIIAGSAFTILFGVMLFVFAGPVASVFFFFIAAILFLMGMWQVIVLLSLGRFGRTGWLYVFPALTILTSMLLLAPNVQKAYICAAALILFGVSEIVSAWRVGNASSLRDKMARDAAQEQAADVDVQDQPVPDVEVVKVEIVEEDDDVDEQ
ncbi:MAG: hypothetical protein MJY67_08110 [Bacteroidales bacterium]|nr:hypothetical protein [Bacteroidales bacterium]